VRSENGSVVESRVDMENGSVEENGSVVRLNWGCGSHTAAGWINSDVKDDAGVDLVADIRDGLPLASGSCDYVVSIHALPEFSYPEMPGILGELRRVLKPGGCLRLGLPDLRRGIDAYLRKEQDYFKVDAAEVESEGGRFIVHMLWYGYSRTLFTVDFAAELLRKAGFVEVGECAFGVTKSEFGEITDLDNRSEESFFVEARRGADEDLVIPARRGAEEDHMEPASGDTTQERSMQIIEMSHATPNDRLQGHFRVQQEDSKLELVGWALGADSPVMSVEVVSAGEVVASTSAAIERPDIANAFPDVAGAGTCGFRLAIEPSGKGQSRLELRATLKDGEHAAIGEIEVSTPGRRKGILRRFG
jgi:predicted SAM-dependent methyltransferase